MTTAHDTTDDSVASVQHLGRLIDTEGDCADTDVPQKWRPLSGFTPGEYDQYAAWACHRCPIIAACGVYAIATNQTAGIWGAMAQHRLASLVAQQGEAIRQDLAHGVPVEEASQAVYAS